MNSPLYSRVCLPWEGSSKITGRDLLFSQPQLVCTSPFSSTSSFNANLRDWIYRPNRRCDRRLHLAEGVLGFYDGQFEWRCEPGPCASNPQPPFGPTWPCMGMAFEICCRLPRAPQHRIPIDLLSPQRSTLHAPLPGHRPCSVLPYWHRGVFLGLQRGRGMYSATDLINVMANRQ